MTQTVWDQTYRGGTVGPFQQVQNRGCVHGTVHVQPAGELTNLGYVEHIVVRSEGSLVMAGMAGAIDAERPSDVLLVLETHEGGRVNRPMQAGEERNLPFTGPEGWGLLDRCWADCVFAINDVIEAAGLQRWADKTFGAKPGTVIALNAALAAMSVTDMSDARMWALMSASAFNPTDELKLAHPKERKMWSPSECRFDGDPPPAQ